jgi:DNA ligase (NAD+)
LRNRKDDIEYTIDNLKECASRYNIPIDGLVIAYNDVAYGESLGMTSKFPRHSLAFKFEDELAETAYRGLDIQTTRTGIVSLTATFDPVELDGTEVSRASVHNVDIWESLQLGIDDVISVYKANQIIPQISENLTKSKTEELPIRCPTCNSQLEIIKPKEARFLSCPNPDCKAKLIGKLEHFVSRDCMNIVGLSEQTLEKFIERGFINDFVDIYRLERYAKEIKKMDGFGLKSYNKLIESIENSKTVALANFINALGISKVGLSGAKLLAKHFKNDLHRIISASKLHLREVDGFGEIIVNNIFDYFSNEENMRIAFELEEYVNFTSDTNDSSGNSLDGKVFVITGTFEQLTRKEITKLIEDLDGKVSGSVSKKTDYLIAGDKAGSKLEDSKKLGIKIIDENKFIQLMGKF